jgi:hypothetical protein
MPLPKIELPLYELTLPSNGKKVQYRPFTVKEEKILLMAQESKDSSQIIQSIKQVINNCLIDYEIDNLAIFDVEYILITLRSRSIDNLVKFTIDDPDTKEKIELALDISEVKVEKSSDHTNKIKLNEEYILLMRYPSIDEYAGILLDNKSESQKSFDIMIKCMDMLASEKEVLKFKDFSEKEIQEFVDSLTNDVVKEIKKFFDTMPKIRFELDYKNSKNDMKKFVIQGTETFFI